MEGVPRQAHLNTRASGCFVSTLFAKVANENQPTILVSVLTHGRTILRSLCHPRLSCSLHQPGEAPVSHHHSLHGDVRGHRRALRHDDQHGGYSLTRVGERKRRKEVVQAYTTKPLSFTRGDLGPAAAATKTVSPLLALCLLFLVACRCTTVNRLLQLSFLSLKRAQRYSTVQYRGEAWCFDWSPEPLDPLSPLSILKLPLTHAHRKPCFLES